MNMEHKMTIFCFSERRCNFLKRGMTSHGRDLFLKVEVFAAELESRQHEPNGNLLVELRIFLQSATCIFS